MSEDPKDPPQKRDVEPDHPLFAAYLKLNRAQDHFHALSAEVKEFVASEFYTTFAQYDPDRKIVLECARIKQHPPIVWSVHVGEILHNLRCALDYLVFELIRLNTRAESISTKAQFPIFETEAGFKKRQGNMLAGVSDEARTLIRSEQPFLRKEPRRLPI